MRFRFRFGLCMYRGLWNQRFGETKTFLQREGSDKGGGLPGSCPEIMYVIMISPPPRVAIAHRLVVCSWRMEGGGWRSGLLRGWLTWGALFSRSRGRKHVTSRDTARQVDAARRPVPMIQFVCSPAIRPVFLWNLAGEVFCLLLASPPPLRSSGGRSSVASTGNCFKCETGGGRASSNLRRRRGRALYLSMQGLPGQQ